MWQWRGCVINVIKYISVSSQLFLCAMDGVDGEFLIGGGERGPIEEDSRTFNQSSSAKRTSITKHHLHGPWSMSMSMSIINSEPCYGIFCHRQYVDRVSNTLLNIDDEWRTINGTSEEKTSSPAKNQSSKCILVPTSMEKGPRKSRTGYSLLVLQNCALSSPAQLPPTARRQLSWAGKLSHKTEIDSLSSAAQEQSDIDTKIAGKKRTRSNEQEADVLSCSYTTVIDAVAKDIWQALSDNGFDTDKDVLRIDVYPKTINSNSEVCLGIQRAAKAACSCDTDTPIKLALSASAVTVVVSVVFTSQHTALWGIACNSEHFEKLNQRLNDFATKEVIVEATDSKSGLDKSTSSSLSQDIPVSRAHYKLAQVFEDENLLDKIASLRCIDGPGKDSKHLLLNHGSGLDVGASPGGWTQVLHNQLCIPTVALDPAVLAKRVESLKGVTHIRAELNSKEAIAGLSQHAPYSTIVCDACLSNPKALIEKIIEALESVKKILKENGNEKQVITFPLCTVFTLKFPHKTTNSVARFIETTSDALPGYFRRISALDGVGDIEITYKICHLFANSISERTVIALFHRK